MALPKREYPESPLVGVGGVVVRDDRVLLIRRGTEPALGEWTIPGGLLEIGETLIEGVVRELREETGLTVRVVELIEALERIFYDSTDLAYDSSDLRCRTLFVPKGADFETSPAGTANPPPIAAAAPEAATPPPAAESGGGCRTLFGSKGADSKAPPAGAAGLPPAAGLAADLAASQQAAQPVVSAGSSEPGGPAESVGAPRPRPRYHYVILDYLCEAVSGEPRPGSDITALAWVPESGLASYQLTPAATRVVQKAFARARAHRTKP